MFHDLEYLDARNPQMVEVKTPSPAGVRMDAVDAHRWLPSHVSHKPLSRDAWRPLADPAQVWTFSLLDPPQSSETREVDLTVTADRNANAGAERVGVSVPGVLRN